MDVAENVRCFVGLGANLGDREQNLRQALAHLGQTPGVRVIRLSSFEETAPLGPHPQGAYLNAVACIDTTLPPLDLLDRLQNIENQLGRLRDERWGPRTIDLDLLVYGRERISHPRLTVPHPEIARREFVQRELKEAGYLE